MRVQPVTCNAWNRSQCTSTAKPHTNSVRVASMVARAPPLSRFVTVTPKKLKNAICGKTFGVLKVLNRLSRWPDSRVLSARHPELSARLPASSQKGPQWLTEMMEATIDACSCQEAATSCHAPRASSSGSPLPSLTIVTSGRAIALMMRPQKPCELPSKILGAALA